MPGRIAWYISQGEYFYIIMIVFLIIFFFYSQSPIYTRCIVLKQQCVPHTNTNILAMIPTYGRVLSTIEKALWKLVEEY